MYEAPAHERGWFALLGERLLELELLVQVNVEGIGMCPVFVDSNTY